MRWTDGDFAEAIRRWIFRPAARVKFEPDVCVIGTPIELSDMRTGVETATPGWWVRVRMSTFRLA
jgi:hypothetical protein